MVIEIGGVKHPLTFNMGFLRMVLKEYGLDLIAGIEVSGDNNYTFLYALVYCGVATTAKVEGKENPITKQQAEDYVDSLHPQKVGEITKAFQDWMTSPQETKPKEDGKKKKNTFHAK